jgi:hypothetical protein
MMCLLAGAPFHISPSELMEMDVEDLIYWQNLALKRLEYEQPDNGSLANNKRRK